MAITAFDWRVAVASSFAWWWGSDESSNTVIGALRDWFRRFLSLKCRITRCNVVKDGNTFEFHHLPCPALIPSGCTWKFIVVKNSYVFQFYLWILVRLLKTSLLLYLCFSFRMSVLQVTFCFCNSPLSFLSLTTSIASSSRRCRCFNSLSFSCWGKWHSCYKLFNSLFYTQLAAYIYCSWHGWTKSAGPVINSSTVHKAIALSFSRGPHLRRVHFSGRQTLLNVSV